MKSKFIALAILFGGATSFGATPVNSSKVQLEFIKDFNFDHYTQFDGADFGGISALSFNEKTGRIKMLSDDFGRFGDPRYFEFGLNKDLELDFKAVRYLKNQDGNRYEYQGYSQSFDGEGMVELDNGEMILATETRLNQTYIHVFKDDQNTSSVEMPKKYSEHEMQVVERYEILDEWLDLKRPRLHCKLSFYAKINYCQLRLKQGKWQQKRSFRIHPVYGEIVHKFMAGGLQHNKGFEGLGISPDKSRVFAMSERSLKQDSPRFEIESNDLSRWNGDSPTENLNRLIVFKKEHGQFRTDTEYLYRYDSRYGNGISEILALDQKNLIVMERAYNGKKNKNTIKLYHINLERGENIADVSQLTTPGEEVVEHKILEKTLIMDLDEIIGQLSEGYQRLDNFEGMSLGPKLADGTQTLILASDNNFSSRQLTKIFIFKLSTLTL